MPVCRSHSSKTATGKCSPAEQQVCSVERSNRAVWGDMPRYIVGPSNNVVTPKS